MTIGIAGLDHLVLRVSDMQRSLAFYCQVLGCVEERRVESLGLVQLRAGASLIDLVPAAGPLPQAGNLEHFCLKLEAFDEARLRAHLQRQGIAAGDTVERYGAGGFGPSIYIQDPDGNTVELKG